MMMRTLSLLPLALAFALGLLLIESSARLPNAWGLGVFGGIGLLLWLLRKRFWPKQSFLEVLAVIWLAIAMGLLWGNFRAEISLEQAFQSQWLKQDLHLEGRITSEIQPGERSFGFRAEIAQSTFKNQVLPLKGQMQLRFYPSQYQKMPDLQVGQHFRAIARVKPPYGQLNPGAMDWEAWQWREGIVASGYIRQWQAIGAVKPSWLTFRYHLAAAMQQHLGEGGGSAVVQAVTVGLRGDFTDDLWQTFANTGTSHLLAISGLHISLVAGLVFALFLGVARLWPALNLWQPISLWALWPALLAATLYSALAGFALPTQRALLMLIAIFALRLLRRPLQPWQGLGLALLLILLLQPKSVLSPSLWLSFAAVAAIVYFFMGKRGSRPWWQNLILLQLWLSVFMIPWTLLFFNQASLISPLANLIAIPWVSFSIVPLALLGTAIWFISEPIAGFFWQLAAYSAESLLVFLNFLGNLPFAALPLGARPWWLLWLGVAVSLWLFAPRAWPGKLPALLSLLLIVSWPPARPAAGELWITVLDVGQGLSVIVQTQNHSLLFDTGKSGQGKQSIVPTLRTFGIRELSMLIVSHDDNDHSGGALEVLSAIPAQKILSGQPQPFAETLKKYGHTPMPEACVSGQRWQWDGVDFLVLHPPVKGRYSNDNAHSCVLLVKTAQQSLLLTGDIGHREEFAILRAHKNVRSTVVVAGHHGSKNSSSPGFIKALQAKVVIFATGFANRYGHPDANVVANFKASGASTWSSAEHGAILLRFNEKKSLTPIPWRQKQARYWRYSTQQAAPTKNAPTSKN